MSEKRNTFAARLLAVLNLPMPLWVFVWVIRGLVFVLFPLAVFLFGSFSAPTATVFVLIAYFVGIGAGALTRRNRLEPVIALKRGYLKSDHYENRIPVLLTVLLKQSTHGWQVEMLAEIQDPTRGPATLRRQLGKVSSQAEAIEKWNAVEWREDGVHVGKGTNEFFLPQGELEPFR